MSAISDQRSEFMHRKGDLGLWAELLVSDLSGEKAAEPEQDC